MSSKPPPRGFAWVLGLLLVGCLAACSGGGAAGEALGRFELSQISVTNGAVWQINRPIRFTFSEAVDFDSVNSNTIQVRQLSGVIALGEFSSVVGEPRAVLFQPICPTRNDFSDAGLQPGGVLYEVNVASSSGPGTTVRSLAGKPLTLGLTLQFRTPTSSILSDLFFDTRPGPPQPVISPGVGSYLGTGGEGATSVAWFEIDPVDGSGSLPANFRVPNNFYSDPATQVAVHLRFDQAVSPSAENISSERLRLEFLDASSTWQRLSTELLLEQNCAGTGASVRITPVGVLPQGRQMRLVVAPEFSDLVGDQNTAALDRFGNMTADAITDGGGVALETADEVLEEFLSPRFEDESSVLPLPRASWGEESLSAAFEFDGTGGPAGEFDLHIPPNSEVIFDTTSTIFFGGDGGLPQYSQLSVGGRLDVRNLVIPESSAMRIQGPNPARILATGDVIIDGSLTINGSHAATVTTVNSPHQPESGGAGQGGGGTGGVGSWVTTQVTMRGGRGEGAFGALNLGGEGGESGWAQQGQTDGTFRRGGGGGGGVLGNDQLVKWFDGTATYECADQRIYGLDAESGHVGSDLANSAQGNHIPYGGRTAPSPLTLTPERDDDFWGAMIQNVGSTSPLSPERLVIGELTQPTPGSGGGAGGDATYVNPADSYPPSEFYWSNQDKGCGGGGGAGALTILAIGDIVIGPSGSIQARGGHGGGGEHSINSFRTGGGSGGGSGGHIILQTAGILDLSEVFAQYGVIAIDARGGQGGAGEKIFGQPEPNGGADNTGNTTQIWFDAKHVGANGTDNPWEVVPATCIDEGNGGYLDSLPGAGNNSFVVRCAGGDGGPGIVQIHVQDLATDIINPGGNPSTGNTGDLALLGATVRPVPHGYDVNSSSWQDQLLPQFGRRSMAQSKWIALGEATVDPVDSALGELAFLFGGTDGASGIVATTGGQVTELAPLLTEPALLLDGQDPTHRTALLDASGLTGADEIYKRNAQLLRRFRLRVGSQVFEVASSTYHESSDQLALVVSSSGPTLEFASGAVELVPRYFGIRTLGIPDLLPDSAEVVVEFQLAQEGNPGTPDLDQSTEFVGRLAGEDLNSLGVDPSLVRFLRFRVTFDIATGSSELNSNSPRPEIDFLRLPYRF